jgi:hypothetical protein
MRDDGGDLAGRNIGVAVGKDHLSSALMSDASVSANCSRSNHGTIAFGLDHREIITN